MLGMFIGGDLALRYATNRKAENINKLQEQYIESQIWNLLIALPTYKKAENANVDWILTNYPLMLRGAFMTLIELHKTGDYPNKNKEITEVLTKTKDFMVQRPDQFIDMELKPLTLQNIQTPTKEESLNPKKNDPLRKQLQEAFDYVDGLNEASY